MTMRIIQYSAYVQQAGYVIIVPDLGNQHLEDLLLPREGLLRAALTLQIGRQLSKEGRIRYFETIILFIGS